MAKKGKQQHGQPQLGHEDSQRFVNEEAKLQSEYEIKTRKFHQEKGFLINK